MTLSAPTKPVFVISLILAIVALLGAYDVLPVVLDGSNAFWAAIAAYALLLVGNLSREL